MLAPRELELLREAVTLCGSLPRANDLSIHAIAQAMKSDKKSVAGVTKWVLLESVGRARIVDGREISTQVLHASLRAALLTSSDHGAG